jgi:hypothetical protein
MKIFLTIFISLIVLFLFSNVQLKKISRERQIKITEKTKKLYDKTLDPKNNPRTKLQFIKIAIHGFLDQLELPERVIEDKLLEASTADLMFSMKLMKNVNRGIEDASALKKLKKFLKYSEIADRLKNKVYMDNAITFMKKFFKK